MTYTVIPTPLPEVLLLEPDAFHDERGTFFESFNARDFERATGVQQSFVQDNHSISLKGVLRGLHYQVANSQGKLVRVAAGEVFDVAVDIRAKSSSFGAWFGTTLSARNRRQLWIPEGFAHGFLALSDSAHVLYKTTSYYSPTHERTLAWDDPTLNIAWPTDVVGGKVSLSHKDGLGHAFLELTMSK